MRSCRLTRWIRTTCSSIRFCRFNRHSRRTKQAVSSASFRRRPSKTDMRCSRARSRFWSSASSIVLSLFESPPRWCLCQSMRKRICSLTLLVISYRLDENDDVSTRCWATKRTRRRISSMNRYKLERNRFSAQGFKWKWSRAKRRTSRCW